MDMGTDIGDMELLPLHHHPEYVEECCTLLNSEWPRSRTERMRFLEASNDSLPVCFALVCKKEVLAHCRLSPLKHIPNSGFVEAVVVRQEKRGKGIGKILMTKMEEYAKRIGLQTLMLTTQGQEGFYAKLGFAKCDFVSLYGSPTVSLLGSRDAAREKTEAAASSHVVSPCSSTSATVDKPSTSSAVDTPSSSTSSTVDTPTSSTSAAVSNVLVDPVTDSVPFREIAENIEREHALMSPPPPPPPPSPVCGYSSQTAMLQGFGIPSKTYMKKDIA